MDFPVLFSLDLGTVVWCRSKGRVRTSLCDFTIIVCKCWCVWKRAGGDPRKRWCPSVVTCSHRLPVSHGMWTHLLRVKGAGVGKGPWKEWRFETASVGNGPGSWPEIWRLGEASGMRAQAFPCSVDVRHSAFSFVSETSLQSIPVLSGWLCETFHLN